MSDHCNILYTTSTADKLGNPVLELPHTQRITVDKFPDKKQELFWYFPREVSQPSVQFPLRLWPCPCTYFSRPEQFYLYYTLSAGHDVLIEILIIQLARVRPLTTHLYQVTQLDIPSHFQHVREFLVRVILLAHQDWHVLNISVRRLELLLLAHLGLLAIGQKQPWTRNLSSRTKIHQQVFLSLETLLELYTTRHRDIVCSSWINIVMRDQEIYKKYFPIASDR